MPMRYANEDDVLAQLRMTSADTQYARLVRLENGLCDTFDHKVGTSFGVAPVAETRNASVVSSSPALYPFGNPYDIFGSVLYGTNRLILDTPIRSVTTIEIGGTWGGSAWTDGTALISDEYWLSNETEQGYYAIDLGYGSWVGVVRITGVWGDQATLTVPDDVREALTFITVDEFRTRNASPADLSGPDGITVGTRNPWRFEIVKAAIDRHSVVQVLV